MLLGSFLWTLLSLSNAIKVPSSWKDEQVFLPYYVVVDGLPSAQNVESYYPVSASSSDVNDQVVQNDVVVKLFQKMNPHLQIFQPHVLNDPPRQHFQPIPSDESVVHANIQKDSKKSNDEAHNAQETQREISDKEEIKAVNHEDPGEVPTQPIYPGEGQWAIKGIKHTPHITKNTFKESPNKAASPTQSVENYNSQKHKFQKEFDEFPKKYGLDPSNKSTHDDEDNEGTSATNEFEPYRTYAQVRHTISEARLPKRKRTDPRLKESIKDSKIHTVYTEEGYEDSAYDHGDQSKKSESRESEKGSRNVAQKEKEFDFPKEPPPPREDEENFDESEEDTEESERVQRQEEYKTNQADFGKSVGDDGNDKNQDETESESKADAIIEFDSKKTRAKKPAYHNEQDIIDNMMDESKYGKKIATKSKIMQKGFTKLSKLRLRRSADVDVKKYPHYNSKQVHSLSSLRYVENSDEIPKKSKGSMSFYTRADKIDCPELKDVDPIPERIKNSENQAENSKQITTAPKLDKLGDQIDCLKARYFGQDPLDNPLFKENSMDAPSTFFKDHSEGELEEINDVDYDQDNENQRESKSLENSTEEPLPDAQPYIVIKRIHRRPPNKHFKRNKVYYNGNQHQIQRPRPKIPPQRVPNNIEEYDEYSTNSERISEVHYKDEIKPSEQMNVFADIINNIKNSSRDPGVDSSEMKPVSIMINVIKKPPRNGHNRPRTTTNTPLVAGVYELHDGDKFHGKTSSTKPPVDGNRYVTEAPNRRYKKRRRRPQSTTEVIDIIKTETTKVKKRKIRPEHNIRENIDQYQEETPTNTINMNGFKPIMAKDDLTQSNHKPEFQEIETSPMNKFLVVGMRPPPEKPYVHPNYYITNQFKHRRASQSTIPLRKRFARSTSRRGYSEIQRNLRGRQNTSTTTEKIALEETEDDDYVPHRSRNFHYDERTKKIVYDKKPELDKEEEEIEYEYVEVEEPTHPPPKEKKQEPRRVWPTKFPDGPNYLEFIKKLKEDPNYVQISDPTEKPSTEANAESSTVKDAKTIEDEQPKTFSEYLAILGKVKSDKDYKVIEDPTKRPKSTTPISLEVEEELVDIEEDSLGDVQNSPGAQSTGESSRNTEFSADSELGSKTRNYNPRTSIDTSKYKSIQRSPPTTRHSISSRYNSQDAFKDQDEPNMDQVETKLVRSEIEPASTTTTESFTIDIPTTSIPPTTPLRGTTTLAAKSRRVLVSRRRGTTTPVTSSTESAAETTTTRRLNRGRSRFALTTTEAPKEESTRSRRFLQRRHQSNLTVPKNHKPQYTEARIVQSVRNVKATPRSISLELLRQRNAINASNSNTGDSLRNNLNKTKLEDVEIFKDYDKSKKHGGNYKYKKVQIKITHNYNPFSKDNGEIKDNNDTVPKSFSYYTDSKLPLKINQLKEKSDDVDVSLFDEGNERHQNEAQGENEDFFEENQSIVRSRVKKEDTPAIIKDPSRRLYYYAPL